MENKETLMAAAHGGEKGKALVIYHRVDYDGLFSYAITKKALEEGRVVDGDLKEMRYDVTGYGYNHYDSLENLPDFNDFDLIVIADIALPSDCMSEIYEKCSEKVFWIDHHITTLKDAAENGYCSLMGLRRDGVAACKLCWEFFMSEEVPTLVDLVATNDIWDHETYDWENEVQTLQYGLNLKYHLDAEAIAKDLDNLIESYASVQEDGKLLKGHMEDLYKTWCERYSFEVSVDGKWKGICMICPVFSSKVFASVSEGYDCCVVLEKNGADEGVYNVSVYCDKDIDFSCGEYMKANYQGGGHKGAAGGKMNFAQFMKVIAEHTL